MQTAGGSHYLAGGFFSFQTVKKCVPWSDARSPPRKIILRFGNESYQTFLVAIPKRFSRGYGFSIKYMMCRVKAYSRYIQRGKMIAKQTTFPTAGYAPHKPSSPTATLTPYFESS